MHGNLWPSTNNLPLLLVSEWKMGKKMDLEFLHIRMAKSINMTAKEKNNHGN